MPDGDIPFGMSFSIRRFYMICKRVEIDMIPACVWGMASSRVIVAVHGNMASKTDTATAHLAEFAVQAGWQVLSFDLPEHGDRKGRELPCTMPQCVEDTRKIWAYAHEHWQTVGLFGVSMGAYIALAAPANEPPAFAWLLSPTAATGLRLKRSRKLAEYRLRSVRSTGGRIIRLLRCIRRERHARRRFCTAQRTI